MKLLMILLLVSSSALAQRNYIKNTQKVTFRAGAGTSNKILKMLEVDETLTVLEAGSEWTKVKDAKGTEGYVLNRFLTKAVPFKMQYAWSQKKIEKLETRLKNLRGSSSDKAKAFDDISQKLAAVEKELAETTTNYTELKAGSTDYINLKKKFDANVLLLKENEEKMAKLEGQVSTIYIFWFLAGAGVLFFGWLLGVMGRKKKAGYGGGIKL